MKGNVFAELRLGKSVLRYLTNGRISYSGWQGPALFAAVMHHASFFGRGDALPAMVAIHKILDKSQLTVNWENQPKTRLDELHEQLGQMTSDAGRDTILDQIHDAQRHAPEVDWEIARRMLQQPQEGAKHVAAR